MLTPLLLDPLLFSFGPEELPQLLEDLEPQLLEVIEMVKEYPVRVTRFLNSSYVDSICDWRIYQGNNGREVAKLIANLEMEQEPTTAPAKIKPHIDVEETWLSVLAEISGNTRAPFWRDPVVVASNVPGSLFPDVHELCYTMADGPRRRNLVKIGHQVEHPFFERDLDPWRLRTVGPPATNDASQDNKRNTWKKLPRPPQLPQNLSLQQVVDKLRTKIEFSVNDKYIYYVPTEDWRPLSIEKEHWRNVSIFRQECVQRGRRRGESGYIDRAGRIWVWHDGEVHWDVQINSGDDWRNVSYTGENLDWK